MTKNTKDAPGIGEKYRSLRFVHWVLLFAFLTVAVFLVQKNAIDFQASVIPTRQASPFDGTALPVLKVPKWTALTSEQMKLDYDQIPSDKLVALPAYDPDQLKTAVEQLGWKSESDLSTRNAKITFSTPYMGNYKLDGIEYAGNHPAVDIKIPNNTPLYAIANGIVTKVSDQTTGFGKHIVVKHENVPSPSDAKATMTLYSSYNHLGQLLVAEGDVVSKGQLIGKSGHTGTATTPHVHFQIDNDQAPWHPYWPFTYQEASAAGLTFTEAVNSGLNADKAKQLTTNPMLYVQKYVNGASVVTSTTTSTSSSTSSTTDSTDELPPPVVSPVPTPTPEPATEPVIVPEPVSEPAPPASNPAAAFTIKNDGAFVPDVAETFSIKATDADGNTVLGYKPKDGVYFQILIGGGDIPSDIGPEAFVNGEASFQVTPKTDAGFQLKATDNVIFGESEIMYAGLFSDVAESSEHYKAINFLKKHGVIGGYPDGSFKPGSVVSRVEALKFILEGANARLISDAQLPFPDTKAREWYADYVATGYSKNIVNGYPDSSFKPSNTVNRVEFLKMLLAAMDVKFNPVVTRDLYADVPRDAWFAPYVRYAKDKNLFEVNGNRFGPEEGMTREEVAETIYRIIILKVSGEEAYSSGLSVASDKIKKYFN